MTRGSVARNSATSAVAPQTSPVSRLVAVPRRRRTPCASHRAPSSPRFATHAHAGHSFAKMKFRPPSALIQSGSIVDAADRSGPAATVHASNPAVAMPTSIPGTRQRLSTTISAVPISTANQNAVVPWQMPAIPTSPTAATFRCRTNAATAMMPKPNASRRGWKYGSSEFALVRGMWWRRVMSAASAIVNHHPARCGANPAGGRSCR